MARIRRPKPAPTESELRDEYQKMLKIFASGDENWQQKLKEHILAKGRTEGHHLILYLFTKTVVLSSENITLIQRIEALEKEAQDLEKLIPNEE